jgi:hypothetical protein
MRFGPLSDLAVKASHPEFFTLDIGTTADSQPANLHHHHLKGIKPKIKKGITPRFAMNDLNNFSTFTVPQAKERAKFASVMNYRKQLGSSNFDGNNDMNLKLLTEKELSQVVINQNMTCPRRRKFNYTRCQHKRAQPYKCSGCPKTKAQKYLKSMLQSIYTLLQKG